MRESIYNLKGFSVGLLAGKRADQHSLCVCVCVCGCVCLVFLCMDTHVWWAYRNSLSPAICNPDYAAFHLEQQMSQ